MQTIVTTKKTIIEFLKKRWKVSLIVGIGVLGSVIALVAGSGRSRDEIITVETRNITDTVQIAGRVEADIVADLGFEVAGTVKDVLVKTNNRVAKGDRLVSLDLGTLSAELASARASAAIAYAELQNTKINLAAIQAKQDTLVASAYKQLLSDDLVVEPDSQSYTQTPPIITGRYNGAEGRYKIIIDRELQSEYSIRTFGVEQSGPVKISKTGPTALGANGLYITFPDAVDEYVNTIWYVSIPNTKGSSYVANLNAYEESLRARDEAINEARESIRMQEAGSSIAEAELQKAQAEVARIEALIGQRVLRAPFDGTVTAVSVDPGESIAIGDKAVSVISEGVLGVKIDLPEVDSVKVQVGNKATITLDPFGTSTVFTGTVVSVDRSETIVDGVASYEARVVFDSQDDRIVSGMTADVTIVTRSQDNVVAIPARAITYNEQGKPFVRVLVGKKMEQKEVVVGLRGSDSYVEILAGLQPGQQVVISSSSR